MLIGSFSWDIGSQNTKTNTSYSYITVLNCIVFKVHIYIL